MRLILLGAPGCGKGTHSEWMVKDLGVPQLSTGDILRDAVRNKTELGLKAGEYMESGRLVPDELIIGMMSERMGAEDAKDGFILDGFPRTIPQAEGLAEMLSARGLGLDMVIKIDLATEELVKRLTSRRVCPSCKAVYNISFRPPKVDGVCDVCGGEVIQRVDDTEETVLSRLKVFDEQTAPLIQHYQDQELLAVVDGNVGFEETRGSINKVLGR